MAINRRLFLSSLASGIAGAAAAKAITPPQYRKMPDTDLKLLDNFILYAAGSHGNRVARYQHFYDERSASLLTEIDLKSGHIKRSDVPIAGSHYPFVDADHDRITILDQYGRQGAVLDMDHKFIAHLDAPDGYDFSGHGTLLPGTDMFVASLNFIDPQTSKNEGKLIVVDVAQSTPKVIDIVPSNGLQPHDMALSPDGQTLIIAHNGSTTNHRGDSKYRYLKEIVSPGLAVLDAKTLALRKFIRTPFEAEVTHMDIRADGKVVCCLQQYLNTAKRSRDDALALFESEFGQEDIMLAAVELGRKAKGISLSLPSLLVDLDTGQATPFLENKLYQRQAQSVAYHSSTGKTAVSYPYVNGLLLIAPDGTAEAMSSYGIGLHNLAGLTDLPGTPYMAMAGFDHDISIVDMRTLELVHQIRLPLLKTAHISARRV